MSKRTSQDDSVRHRTWLEAEVSKRRQAAEDADDGVITWQRFPTMHTYKISVSELAGYANPIEEVCRALLVKAGVNGDVTKVLSSWEGVEEYGATITVQGTEEILGRTLDALVDSAIDCQWAHVWDVEGDRYAYVDLFARRRA